MLSYNTTKITDKILQITDPTGVSAFFVFGQKRALLIDSGTGVGNIKHTIDSVTSLPVELVLTHGHGDHVGGAALFDKVHMSHNDLQLLSQHNIRKRMDYAAMFIQGNAKLTVEDFIPDMDKLPQDIVNGQIFDLGGLHVEMIGVPGHTKGMMCPLIVEERTILFGDACNSNTILSDSINSSVTVYLHSLQNLKTQEYRFDKVLYSHGPAEGPSCLDDNIELCHRIMNGTDEAIPFDFLGKSMYRAAQADKYFNRLDGKRGNIVYMR